MDIFSPKDLMGVWLNIHGIFGYESAILDVAHEIYNPLPPSDTDPQRPVYDLAISTRTANALLNAGIDNIGKLVAADRKTLFRITYIGTKSLREINEVLEALGFERKV